MRQMRDRNFGDHTRQDAPPPACPSPRFPQKSTFVYLRLSSRRIDAVDVALPCTADGSSMRGRHVGDDRPVNAQASIDIHIMPSTKCSPFSTMIYCLTLFASRLGLPCRVPATRYRLLHPFEIERSAVGRRQKAKDENFVCPSHGARIFPAKNGRDTKRTLPWEERRAARTPEGRANPGPTRPRRVEGPSLALLRRLPVAAAVASRHVFMWAISDVSGIKFLN